MSDAFSAQLSAFKKSLKSTSDLPQQRRVPLAATSAPAESPSKPSQNTSGVTGIQPSLDTSSGPLVKKQKVGRDPSPLPGDGGKLSGIAERAQLSAAAQAARTANEGNLTMKLMTSSDYIKSKDREVPIFELETSLGFKVDSALMKCLTNVDRIKYNPTTSSFVYLSLHNIKTGEDLLNVLKNQPAFTGLSVKQLRDGWNKCIPTLEQLEKENLIIVHKTKKDNSPRHIWLNLDHLPIRVYNGVSSLQNFEMFVNQSSNTQVKEQTKTKSLDVVFYEMWNDVHIPPHEELVKLLIANGLTPTNANREDKKTKKVKNVQERKQKRSRRSKITNIHMKGILKDYSSKTK